MFIIWSPSPGTDSPTSIWSLFTYLFTYSVCSINIYSVPNICYEFFRHSYHVFWLFLENIISQHQIPHKDTWCVQSASLWALSPWICMERWVFITTSFLKMYPNVYINIILFHEGQKMEYSIFIDWYMHQMQ